MAKILLVEDEMNIHQMVKEFLEKHGDTCISAFSGTEALLQLQMQEADIALVDLMLPGLSGENLIVKMKENYPMPMIVISAKTALSDKVSLLNKGADDYLCKPFALEELYARIQVQLRRNKSSQQQELSFQELTLSNDQRTLSIKDTNVLLTKHEYKIMELLMSHPNRAYTKKEIYEYAWDDFYAADDKTINVHISNIRSKCSFYEKEIIETIWGIGFKMKS